MALAVVTAETAEKSAGAFRTISEVAAEAVRRLAWVFKVEHDARREAHMRQVLRRTLKLPGVERVVVVSV